AMSVLSDSRKKWREQVLSQIVDTAIAKKDGDLAGTIIARIESPLTRVAALQRLSLHYLESKEIWKAREVLNDALKSIKSLEDKTEQALALLRLLPVFLKVDEAMVPALVEQTLKSINNIPTPDDKTDKKIIGEYVKKTLAPLSWQVLPTFELLAEWDEIATSGLVDQIQLREIRTSALLGVAKAKLTTAKRTAAVDKLRKTRAQSTQHN
ncbi:MAG: hypothetical protein ND895_13595, partial [Pyrinomonadaceae bacterium]|nr:hypothetical protein [Pyrinomonadaceae bacterium]